MPIERSHDSEIFSAAWRSSIKVSNVCQDPLEIVFKIIGLITSSPSVTFMRTAKLVRWLHLQMEWVSLEEKVSKVHPFLDHMPLLFSPLGRNFKISSVHGWLKGLHSQIWPLMNVYSKRKINILYIFWTHPALKSHQTHIGVRVAFDLYCKIINKLSQKTFSSLLYSFI